jgi:hypothetical protein
VEARCKRTLETGEVRLSGAGAVSCTARAKWAMRGHCSASRSTGMRMRIGRDGSREGENSSILSFFSYQDRWCDAWQEEERGAAGMSSLG